MRYFLYVSLLLFGTGCGRQAVRHLGTQQPETMAAKALQPKFDKTLYRCTIDGRFLLKKFHMSGILYLRNFGDTATRVVFQSEMGNTFFDFGWNVQDSFEVYSIIEQMNKPALIKTLKKDFELLLAKNLVQQGAIFKQNENSYAQFKLAESFDTTAFARYYFNKENRLSKIINGDAKRVVVEMSTDTAAILQQLPQQLSIDHKRANFTIYMTQMNQDAD